VMKVFLAGATGAIGKRLVPQLVDHGHTVVGTTRSESRAAMLWNLGAKPVVVDVLDRDAVVAAVVAEKPNVIVHQATALSGVDFRRFDQSFKLTDRLRREGTDNLLAAARAAGVERFVAQSYAGWPYARSGGWVKDEDAPLDPTPAAAMRRALDAIRHLEDAVTGADYLEGIVLRYGGFYGPGTSLSRDGEQLAQIRARKFPVVGDGAGVWSFVHIEDAARATLLALERGGRGIYNVVDDEPAPVREWLPAAAQIVGAKPPRHVPVWLGRLVAGEAATVMMTDVRGASNARAKRELGWLPRHSWREGFAEAA
jgi:2-alkyl-3-oxoalkanoate reductase